ncbi:RnfH family protein [Buchnera aphidicola]|uniref:RnfH family protein n=1 Tax=Buchnera aphidicola TaxID=9 RepID=UPI0015B825CA|nr:RnfH family protein [Buchnera aphidicola]UPT14616.1 RnfH family protein [Buchnera aphidicola (Aphis gossypii)]
MNTIQVTIIYALSEIQYIKKIYIKSNSTVKDAILASNILSMFQGIQFYKNNVGIYNKLVHLNKKIKNGDRIEIYRNLIIDPKERRRNRYYVIKKNLKLKNIK